MLGWPRRLLCLHQFVYLSWGDTEIVHEGHTCWYKSHVKVGCVKCGCVREWRGDFREFRLSKKEAACIAVRLIGIHKWKKQNDLDNS